MSQKILVVRCLPLEVQFQGWLNLVPSFAIDLDNLKQKKLSIAIAGSPNKIEVILGMLRGRYCHVLITDEETAKCLLTRSGYLPGNGDGDIKKGSKLKVV
jgi:acetolactate synthase small subunit